MSVIQGPSAVEPLVHSRLVPLIIGSALFMQTLDATVIANALPAMAVSLGAEPLRLNLAISAYLLCAYVMHARRTTDPAVDLSLFRIPTFAASLLGGAFARLGVGATPFLLAMLLQIGFGLSALEAGAMTFTSAAGALFMKTTAPPIIRTFGFRRVLVVNTVITALIFISYALFTATTPHALLVVALFGGGFFRSLQFTSLQALAFADVPQAKMSRASSLSSMFQQLSQALGVAIAAIALHVTLQLNSSGSLSPGNVSPAFVAIGTMSLCSLWFFLRLPQDAAAEVSGG